MNKKPPYGFYGPYGAPQPYGAYGPYNGTPQPLQKSEAALSWSSLQSKKNVVSKKSHRETSIRTKAKLQEGPKYQHHGDHV